MEEFFNITEIAIVAIITREIVLRTSILNEGYLKILSKIELKSLPLTYLISLTVIVLRDGYDNLAFLSAMGGVLFHSLLTIPITTFIVWKKRKA